MRNNVKCPECGSDNCVYNKSCIQCNAPMIGEDVRLLELTRDVWNHFNGMEDARPEEKQEFCEGIHRLQDMISTRIARKLTKGIYK